MKDLCFSMQGKMILQLSHVDKAEELSDVLCISINNANLREYIKQLKTQNDNIFIGINDVSTVEKCKHAMASGADFLLSSGINDEVIKWCDENGVFIIPGCITPTEITKCIELGLNNINLYPIEAKGGLITAELLKEEFPEVQFWVSGGITKEKAGKYLDSAAVTGVIIEL